MSFFVSALIVIAITISAHAHGQSYRFISASDLNAALSQDSMMLRGYFLGVVDVLKDVEHGGCFTVPLAADADQQMIEGFLSYWSTRSLPEDPVQAISQALVHVYPCGDTLD